MAPSPQRADQRGARSDHRIEHHLTGLGEELDELLRQCLRELGRMGQHATLGAAAGCG